uniref:Uncharacterized protein n=1 Tax=Leersia perrieri TaxID=77586 RepID=A0A0D9WHS3_9ORYZ
MLILSALVFDVDLWRHHLYLHKISAQAKISAAQRRGFDTLVGTLVAWTIWKKRNANVFDDRQRRWPNVFDKLAITA